MSLKYHFQHIKNKTLKNVVFFTFHGTQNETIIFKNQTITIKEQRFFTHNHFYTQKLLHSDISDTFTHTHTDTHTHPFAHKHFYTQNPLTHNQ